MSEPEYDYVIVGSGAGGGSLAANLAGAGQRVLLLEAGADHLNYNYEVPSFHANATEDEDLRWDYFVRHYADDDRQRQDSKFTKERDGVLYPRAGTLGGCTAHHALITVYPHNSDWDEIARRTGDHTWRAGGMRKYFERLERCNYVKKPRPYPSHPLLAAIIRALPLLDRLFGNGSRHGFEGWLPTNLADPSLIFRYRDAQLIKLIYAATRHALASDLGRPLEALEDLVLGAPQRYVDPNDWRVQSEGAEGIWFTPMSTHSARRYAVRDYLHSVAQARPDNLVIKTGALASRVLFDDGNRAVGVEFLDGAHLYRADPRQSYGAAEPATREVFAGREVVLSAGAFNTPQLLKLSGIGPRAELRELGIDVRVDLPGVGENLQDRYEVGVISEMAQDFALLAPCSFGSTDGDSERDPCFTEWRSGKGVYATNGVVLGITKKSKASRPDPDLFIFGLPAFFKGYYPGYSKDIGRKKKYFTWAILKAHTQNSAGRVTLRSADPRDMPRINFHYFDEGNDEAGEDLESMVEGVRFVRRLMKHASPAIKSEVLPGDGVRTREDIEEFVKREAWGHHASCTCKMGSRDDPMAVIDSRFRVHGTKNLRVVDASVFPRIPGFFIVTAVYMASEKATDAILRDAGGRQAVRRLLRRPPGLTNTRTRDRPI